jgi:hypothetical protein
LECNSSALQLPVQRESDAPVATGRLIIASATALLLDFLDDERGRIGGTETESCGRDCSVNLRGFANVVVVAEAERMFQLSLSRHVEVAFNKLDTVSDHPVVTSAKILNTRLATDRSKNRGDRQQHR